MQYQQSEWSFNVSDMVSMHSKMGIGLCCTRAHRHRLRSLADKLINSDTNNCTRTWNWPKRNNSNNNSKLLYASRKIQAIEKWETGGRDEDREWAVMSGVLRPLTAFCPSSSATQSHRYSDIYIAFRSKESCLFAVLSSVLLSSFSCKFEMQRAAYLLGRCALIYRFTLCVPFNQCYWALVMRIRVWYCSLYKRS